MPEISAYLTFNGNCREAMTFYKEVLGGQLAFRTVGEPYPPGLMPGRISDLILQAILTREGLVLLGSDMVPEQGLIKGNSISLLLNCRDEQETRLIYEKLSEGGNATYPLAISATGNLFGNLTDQFGNHWLLRCDKK